MANKTTKREISITEGGHITLTTTTTLEHFGGDEEVTTHTKTLKHSQVTKNLFGIIRELLAMEDAAAKIEIKEVN